MALRQAWQLREEETFSHLKCGTFIKCFLSHFSVFVPVPDFALVRPLLFLLLVHEVNMNDTCVCQSPSQPNSQLIDKLTVKSKSPENLKELIDLCWI